MDDPLSNKRIMISAYLKTPPADLILISEVFKHSPVSDLSEIQFSAF